MHKVIITGCGGYIGSAVTKKLLCEGITVYGIDIKNELMNKFKQFDNFISLEADFSNYETLFDKINDTVSVFYHFAWAGGFLKEKLNDYNLQLLNAHASCKAIESAISLGCEKFVYAGTVNEIEIHQFLNNFSTFKSRPTCIYASAKLISEITCRTIAQEHNISYVSGLIPMIYGEGNRSKQMINVVLNSLINGVSPDLIQGNNLYDLVYIDDIAEAFKMIGANGEDGKRYYIGHKKLRTFRQLIENIRDLINPSVNLNFGKYSDPLNLDYSLIDLNLLYNDTGFECKTDFRESILKTAEWLKMNDIF